MKRSILAIFAALALAVSMPVAAQFEEQEPQQQQELQQEQQQQPGQMQSMTGTVIEWDDQAMILTLRTDQGIQEVRIEDQNVLPEEGLSQGDEVTVQAQQNTQGQMVASQVQTEGAQQQQQQQLAQQQPQEQQEQQEQQQFQEEQLPATGSTLPLVGLLGLLSVAAALGVRFLAR
ncbi:MAG: hypothetical protein ACLF0P_16465 [Thermoanaerobaculia bacterium]